MKETKFRGFIQLSQRNAIKEQENVHVSYFYLYMILLPLLYTHEVMFCCGLLSIRPQQVRNDYIVYTVCHMIFIYR